jgi:hypothetical protein
MQSDYPIRHHEKRGLLRIIAVLLPACLLIACASAPAVNAPTATARAERAITRATQMAAQHNATFSISEEQATATAQANQDRLLEASSWPVVFSDTFDDNANEWVVGKESGEYADAEFTITGQKFHWGAVSHEGFVWWNRPTIPRVADFHAAVDIQQTAGPETGYAGMTLHMDEDGNYYVFEIRNNGEYSFYEYFTEEWIALLNWTPSPFIQVGEVNHIEVLAEGGLFSLFINGEWIADVEARTISDGRTGLLVGLDEADETAAWEFDNFELHAPSIIEETPQPEGTPTP